MLGTIAPACPRLKELGLEGYDAELGVQPAAPLAHVTRLEVCDSLLSYGSDLSAAFPQLVALQRHGHGEFSSGWMDATRGHPMLQTLEGFA